MHPIATNQKTEARRIAREIFPSLPTAKTVARDDRTREEEDEEEEEEQDYNGVKTEGQPDTRDN